MVNRISIQDEAILEHVARYRLTLPELLAKSGLLLDDDPGAATAALNKLVAAHWLAKSPLSPGHSEESYFHLNARSARHLGYDPKYGEPLPPDLRVDSFAIATYCFGDIKRRHFLTKSEFQEKFKALWFSGQPVRYCLERGEADMAQLAFLKVDRDRAGRWDRLIESCARFLQKRTDPKHAAAEHRGHVAAFTELVRRDQFHFTVLTALSDKKRAIELELERRSARDKVVPPIRVHVVPGLLALLFPELADAAEESSG